MGRGVRIAGEVDADGSEVDAMTDYITEMVTERGIAVSIIGGVLMQSEMIRRDPFQDALPCWMPPNIDIRIGEQWIAEHRV